MATARKLPSGNWRCRLYDYTDNAGKKHYKSFTASTKKEAEYLATAYKLEESTSNNNLTIGKATEQYINNRLSILSPTTVRTYKGIAVNQIDKIAKLKIDSITQEQVQVFSNSIAEMCYSGFGIILRHPIVCILHAVDGLKEKMKK